MTYRSFVALAVTATLYAFAAGCGDDDAAVSPPECEAIIARCHPLDTGSGPAHDCHAYAEAAGRTAAECTAMQTSCFATCAAPTDAGDTDGGTHDQDAGGAATDAGGGATDAGDVAADAG